MLVGALFLLSAAVRSEAPQKALALVDEAVALAEGAGARWSVASGTMHRSYCLLALGDSSEALAGFADAAVLTYDVQDLRAFGSTVESIASLIAGHGRHDEAVRFLGYTIRLRAELGDVAGIPIEVAHRNRLLNRLQSELGETFDTVWEEGQRLEAEQVADLAPVIAREVLAQGA